MRTPLYPWPMFCSTMSMTPRTRSMLSGSPTDTEWDRMMFSWSWAVDSLSMALVHSAPKPVVTPYITRSSSTHCSTRARERSTRAAYSGENLTFRPNRATETKSSNVMGSPKIKAFISSISQYLNYTSI